VGTRDWTLEVLLGFPGAELLLQGVAIRPGKAGIKARALPATTLGQPSTDRHYRYRNVQP
jgi:hypothetical protein